MSEESRLRWRCRRGVREVELLFERFLDSDYRAFDARRRMLFERLLDYPDAQLLEYLMGVAEPPDREMVDVIDAIRRAPSA